MMDMELVIVTVGLIVLVTAAWATVTMVMVGASMGSILCTTTRVWLSTVRWPRQRGTRGFNTRCGKVVGEV